MGVGLDSLVVTVDWAVALAVGLGFALSLGEPFVGGSIWERVTCELTGVGTRRLRMVSSS